MNPPASQVHGVSAPLHEPGPQARHAAGAAAGDAADAAGAGAGTYEPIAAWCWGQGIKPKNVMVI